MFTGSLVRRTLSGAAVLSLAAGLSACSGTTSSVPSATTQSQAFAPAAASEETMLGSLSLDRREAESIGLRILSAGAYASPIVGRRPMSFPWHGAVFPESTHAKDLTYYGGPVTQTLAAVDIYVNSSSGSPWGSPATFQVNLGKSTMIHMVDQYMRPNGNTANNRYTYAGSYSVTYNTSSTLQDSDVNAIVHAVAAQYGHTGYGTEYHVFFQKGVSQCSTSAGGCYSPNDPANWTYCAYHGSTTFSDLGFTLYSVEPYQNVNGCQINGSSPNGLLIDSTASTLSHETFETITDADVADATTYGPPLAWYNATYGEIGDECAPAAGVRTGVVNLNGKNYGIQPEYSNASHACKFSQ